MAHVIDNLEFGRIPRPSIAHNIDKINELVDYVNENDDLIHNQVYQSVTGNDVVTGNNALANSNAKRFSVHGNTTTDAGSLQSVKVEGIKTFGKNLLDPLQCTPKKYVIKASGVLGDSNGWSASGFIEVAGGYSYIFSGITNGWSGAAGTAFYDVNKTFISSVSSQTYVLTPPLDAKYMRISFQTETVDGIQVEFGTVATSYKPYHAGVTREIPAATYFPDGMRSAGSAYDEITSEKAVTRIGSVDLGSLNWTYDTQNNYFTTTGITSRKPGFNALICAKYTTASLPSTSALPDNQIVGDMGSITIYIRDSNYTDAATFKAAMSGVMLYYELATPTENAIDPPIDTPVIPESQFTAIVQKNNVVPVPFELTYYIDANSTIDDIIARIEALEQGNRTTSALPVTVEKQTEINENKPDIIGDETTEKESEDI